MTIQPGSKQDPYDLVVIGGGINGAAIARDAALRRLKVVLLEKNDFGSGSSSKTSKLAHGGVRYLEQLQFGLVKESLRERSLLLKNAPHLVKPLSFLLPVYSDGPHSLWKINLGLYLYDYLAGNGGLPGHCKLSPEGILDKVPGLKAEGLRGGCTYYDAQMLDNRIVIETIISAERAGAKVCNHTEVTGLIKEQSQIKGVGFFNALTGENGEFHGRVVVNATGAWSAKISDMEPNAIHCRPTPTKGVHLIIPKILSDIALLLRAPQDGRVFFVLPWGQFSIIGTTDTHFDGNPDQLVVEPEDRDYLLTALNFFFPDKHLTEASIISSFAGLRPLVATGRDHFPSDIIREHAIQVSSGGLITVLGGKYTTHRLIAEKTVDVVMKRRAIVDAPGFKNCVPCVTMQEPLPGASGPYSLLVADERLKAAGLNDRIKDHLLNTYGTASLAILDIMTEDSREAELICDPFPYVFAEVTYSVKAEHVKTLQDWILRSGLIAFPENEEKECFERISNKIAEILSK